MQGPFQKRVQSDGKALTTLASSFKEEWDSEGPSVPGLSPLEVSKRLKLFQDKFTGHKRKWEACKAGETLFGLPPTPVPELVHVQEELSSLGQLYRLYLQVLGLVESAGGWTWSEAVGQLVGMETQVTEFQAQGKKLPKVRSIGTI